MQVTSTGLFRSLMTGAIALGFMGTAAISTPVAAQTACVNEPGLGFLDPEEDGVLTLAELQEIAAAFPDNARLQELVGQAAGDPNFAIQYDGDCETPDDGNGETPDDGNGETPDDGNGETPDDGNGETPGGEQPGGETPDGETGTDDGVSELPDTGAGVAESNSTSWIMMGVGSLMAAAGAFIFRTKKA